MTESSLGEGGDHPRSKGDNPVPRGSLNHEDGLAIGGKAQGLTESLARLGESYQLDERPYFDRMGDDGDTAGMMNGGGNESVLVQDKYDITTPVLPVCQGDVHEDPDTPPSVGSNSN